MTSNQTQQLPLEVLAHKLEHLAIDLLSDEFHEEANLVAESARRLREAGAILDGTNP